WAKAPAAISAISAIIRRPIERLCYQQDERPDDRCPTNIARCREMLSASSLEGSAALPGLHDGHLPPPAAQRVPTQNVTRGTPAPILRGFSESPAPPRAATLALRDAPRPSHAVLRCAPAPLHAAPPPVPVALPIATSTPPTEVPLSESGSTGTSSCLL